jgi:hypothetical protein
MMDTNWKCWFTWLYNNAVKCYGLEFNKDPTDRQSAKPTIGPKNNLHSCVMLSRANVFCTPGSLIQTSIDEIAGCSMRGEICQVCPNVPIYFLNRKVLWEFVRNGSMSSQLTEPGSDDVLELRSRYTDNDLMPWWVNLDQIKLLLNADDEILEISK